MKSQQRLFDEHIRVALLQVGTDDQSALCFKPRPTMWLPHRAPAGAAGSRGWGHCPHGPAGEARPEQSLAIHKIRNGRQLTCCPGCACSAPDPEDEGRGEVAGACGLWWRPAQTGLLTDGESSPGVGRGWPRAPLRAAGAQEACPAEGAFCERHPGERGHCRGLAI